MRNKKGHNKRVKVGDFAMTLIIKLFVFLPTPTLYMLPQVGQKRDLQRKGVNFISPQSGHTKKAPP